MALVGLVFGIFSNLMRQRYAEMKKHQAQMEELQNIRFNVLSWGNKLLRWRVEKMEQDSRDPGKGRSNQA